VPFKLVKKVYFPFAELISKSSKEVKKQKKTRTSLGKDVTHLMLPKQEPSFHKINFV
jgi:hypothetical protein